jgi:hypothetical protein
MAAGANPTAGVEVATSKNHRVAGSVRRRMFAGRACVFDNFAEASI